MWSPEDIEDMNPPEPGQWRSFLAHIYEIAAATPHDLVEWSELLERNHGPHILAACQLPFQLGAGSDPVRVSGWREGVTVDLQFSPRSRAIDHNGRLLPPAPGDPEYTPVGENLDRTYFTQVTGLIRLWSRRASLHPKYVNCITPRGLRNETIGRVGDWMDSPEASMPLPARRYAPLSAQAFQAEIAWSSHRIPCGDQLISHFYFAAGFRPLEVFPALWAPHLPVLLMVKVLEHAS